MAGNMKDPYQILGSKCNKKAPDDNRDLELRLCYRQKILDYTADRLNSPTNRKITALDFRRIYRAYETLGDRNKRKHYDETGQWTSEIPIEEYTLQQLASEPELINEFKSRVEKATLKEINEKQGFTQQTAMYCAARACNTEAVEFLTEQDADPDITQRTGSTSLHAAAFFGHIEMVKCLLSCGANYNAKIDFGNVPETEGNEMEMERVFSEMKTNPYVRVAAGDLDWLKTNLNTEENHIDKQYFKLRQTLLHCAAKKGYFDIVQWLIQEKKANLDILDVNSNSPLHLSTHKGYEGIVKFLMESGADATVINKWGFTAEQEGLIHDDKISSIFRKIRNYDMFKMAAEGHLWWFQYHFDITRVNDVSETGASVLYVACRYGHVAIARFLLDNGAVVNGRLKSETGSTALHGAVFHNHVEVVRLLLTYGVDVTIKNTLGESVFDNIQSREMRELLEERRKAIKENRLLAVQIYGDGKTSGIKPLVTVDLPIDATVADLKKAIPQHLRDTCAEFTVARRPLLSSSDSDILLSVLYRCRYGRTKFIESPICLIGHERRRYNNNKHALAPDLDPLNPRSFETTYSAKYIRKKVKVLANLRERQKFTYGNFSMIFSPDSVTNEIEFDLNYVESSSISKDHASSRFIFFFQISCKTPDDRLTEMPEVYLDHERQYQLHMWVNKTGFWITSRTRGQRLFTMNGYYAFVKHVHVIPYLLVVPTDMAVGAALENPLIDRVKPILCKAFQVRVHDRAKFPHVAYHGTTLKAIQSILMDGLVMPSTVVSNGLRVVPPAYHIGRGVKAFGVEDFSNAIFLSPSIHYCSDPAYAQAFKFLDKIWIAVLECGVEDHSYEEFPCTVPGYAAHPEDNLTKIEWRITRPAAIEILSVLLIQQQLTRLQMEKLRAEKLGLKPNETS